MCDYFSNVCLVFSLLALGGLLLFSKVPQVPSTFNFQVSNICWVKLDLWNKGKNTHPKVFPLVFNKLILSWGRRGSGRWLLCEIQKMNNQKGRNNHKSNHLLNVYDMPGNTLSVVHGLPHLILWVIIISILQIWELLLSFLFCRHRNWGSGTHT